MKSGKIRFIVMSVVAYSVILVLLVSAVFVLVSHATGEEPFVGNYSVMWLKTESMEPTIHQRSYILVKKASAEDVEKGDVIVFISDDPRIEGMRNTHRVVEVIGDHSEFVTRGDNTSSNIVVDESTAKAENIIGKYVRTLPFMSLMGRFLSSTVGIFAVGVFILAILMILYLPEMTKVMKKAEQIKNDKDAMIDELVKQEVERLKKEAEQKKSVEDGSPESTGEDVTGAE